MRTPYEGGWQGIIIIIIISALRSCRHARVECGVDLPLNVAPERGCRHEESSDVGEQERHSQRHTAPPLPLKWREIKEKKLRETLIGGGKMEQEEAP